MSVPIRAAVATAASAYADAHGIDWEDVRVSLAPYGGARENLYLIRLGAHDCAPKQIVVNVFGQVIH